MADTNTLYHDEIFDNNSVVIEMVAQLSEATLPGSQHNVLVTVDYGMDGVDYLNNVSVDATTPDSPVFNAVSCADYPPNIDLSFYVISRFVYVYIVYFSLFLCCPCAK